MKNLLLLFFFVTTVISQSQEDILRDLREENVPYAQENPNQNESSLEKLKSIHRSVTAALENKLDNQAIEEGEKLEKYGIIPDKLNLRGKKELGEREILYLKIRRLRAEAYYNLREFNLALSDSRFIVENHPKPVVFDYTRYAVSLYYSGDKKGSKRILMQAKSRFKNENDQIILSKTDQLLFPN